MSTLTMLPESVYLAVALSISGLLMLGDDLLGVVVLKVCMRLVPCAIYMSLDWI